jgi:hypothetical protein
LNKKRDPGDQIPPSMLLVMLQLLVQGVDELSQVQTNAELNKVANGVTIDYDTYTWLMTKRIILQNPTLAVGPLIYITLTTATLSQMYTPLLHMTHRTRILSQSECTPTKCMP